MRSHSLKDQPLFLDLVNEDPVRLNMAIPAPGEVTDKPVIAMDIIKRFADKKCSRNDLELFQVFPTTLGQVKILGKLLRVNRGIHQTPSFLNRSSAFSQTIRSRPASVASNV